MNISFETQIFSLQTPSLIEQPLLKDKVTKAVGICFSGGGSRALSATMGQLRGLKHLNVLDKVNFISSVSGGTWASALYTYLPLMYDEEDFLGHVVVNQNDLTLLNWDKKHPEYALDYLPPANLGNVPTNLGILNDLEALLKFKLEYGYQNDDLWQGLIGSIVLQPWNLWNDNLNGFPDTYFSYTSSYLNAKNGILDHNKQLSEKQFYCVQRKRPIYIMNSSIVSDPQTAGSELLPFESSSIGLGVRNSFQNVGPNGRDIGGGFIQPFAMGSSWLDDMQNHYCQVTPPSRPFSLSDMVSISSAAFAEMIQKSFPIFDGIIPKYYYWPVHNHTDPKNSAYLYDFADGGSLEDTGITSLLNRNLPNIIAFVNSPTPLQKNNKGQIIIDSQVQLLFGITPSAESLKYKELHRQDIPNNDVSFTQVFDSSYYDELVNGLWNANSGQNGATAMFTQTLPVLPNSNFGIVGNYTVTVLWIYNTTVAAWEELLKWEVRDFLKLVSNFPNYNTITQLKLSATEVNLLAQLSCWNIINDNSAKQVYALFN